MNSLTVTICRDADRGWGLALADERPCRLANVCGRAQLAGLQSGDVVTHMDGNDVRTMAHAQIAKRLAESNGVLTLSVSVSMA